MVELSEIVPLITFVEKHIFQTLAELGRGIEDFRLELAFRLLAVLGGPLISKEEGTLILQISHPREKLSDEKADISILGFALQDFVDLVVHPIDHARFWFLDRWREFGHHLARVHLSWQELRRFWGRHDREASEVINCSIYLSLVAMDEDEVEGLS